MVAGVEEGGHILYEALSPCKQWSCPWCRGECQAEATVSRAGVHGQGEVVLWFPWQKTGHQR